MDVRPYSSFEELAVNNEQEDASAVAALPQAFGLVFAPNADGNGKNNNSPKLFCRGS
ncbi:hypothetical protein PN836_005995 [Ningiella sp. W23]|uniref:hypothetical protein n=1 Tax=Ningiella sp. W23 TaxID=3023715 RepID=UPI003757E09E